MGDIGDYWREAKADREHKLFTGLWPGQRKCEDCDKPFYPKEKWHRRCGKCTRKRKADK